MQVALPPVPADEDGVAAEVVDVAAVQRLVDVTYEVRQEHQALRQVVCVSMRANVVKKSELLRVLTGSKLMALT